MNYYIEIYRVVAEKTLDCLFEFETDSRDLFYSILWQNRHNFAIGTPAMENVIINAYVDGDIYMSWRNGDDEYV